MTVELPLPRVARRLGERVQQAGGRTFVVGGVVRDHLLQRPVKDWDLEVFGLPLTELEGVLRDLGRVNAVGRSFGVFKLMSGKREIDVSIPRRDSKVGPGHRGIAVEGDPDMTLEEAVTRRDLTINAMMVDVVTGELIDLADGRVDLDARLLRPVDEDTFLEDPLRALRAVQFAARFDFEATPGLRALCSRAPVAELPSERILGEWTKLMLRGQRPSTGLRLARETGLLTRTFPTLHDDPSLDGPLDRGGAAFAGLEPQGRALAAFLLTWLSASPAAAVQGVLDRLGVHRWSGYAIREQLLRAHPELEGRTQTDAALRHLSTRCHPGLLLPVQIALYPDDAALIAALARASELDVLWQAPDPLVLGRDLLAMGLAPGPRVGTLLGQLYQQQLDGEWSTRDQALDAARRLVSP